MANYEFKASYCLAIKNWCKGGKSWITFAASIDVPVSQLTMWSDDPTTGFKEAMEIAQLQELSFWESQMLLAMSNQDKDVINIAKFRLDQLYSLMEKCYKHNFNVTLPSEIRKERNTDYGSTSVNRDVLAEIQHDAR